MLKRVLLAVNQTNTLAVQGRHINVVLASGIVTARIQYKNGSVYETDFVSGMAFETEEEFVSVGFTSDTAQQMQVWLSDIPLTYSPVDARLVGSAALSSSVGEVYSGTPQILLAAESGRNKVTISPEADILIGGPNLNLKNGIPVAAGSVFEFATQGAVYGLEATGAYPPFYTADIEESGFVNPDVFTVASPRCIFTRSGDEFVCSNGASGFTRYSAIDGAILGTFNTGATPAHYAVTEHGGLVGYPCADGNDLTWLTIDPETLAFNEYSMGFDGLNYSARYADAFDGKIVAAIDGQNTIAFSTDEGQTWTESAAPTGLTGTIRGCALNASGHIYVLYADNIAKSTDNGATWSTFATTYTTSGEIPFAIDKLTNRLYQIGSGGTLFWSDDDGANWLGSADIAALTFCVCVVEKGGTIYVTSSKGHGAKVGDGDWMVEIGRADPNTRGIHIGKDGRFYMGGQSVGSNFYVAQGQQILTGGLEVAIMAESN